MLIPADGRFTTLLGHTSDEAGRPLRRLDSTDGSNTLETA
jgi:hypothetical protein